MKKTLLRLSILLAAITTGFSAYAVPACPTPTQVKQADGSFITLQLIGDEFSNVTITKDGYAVAYNENTRNWEYARNIDGQYICTGTVAHDPGMRSATENTIVAGLEKVSEENIAVSPEQKDLKAISRSMTAAESKEKHIDYSKFKGLIILAEYNDCPFTRSDYGTIVNDMVNKENFDGYMSNAMIPEKIECTGSVLDYFTDSSYGKFKPKFDVVGPIKIDVQSTYINQTNYAQSVIKMTLLTADESINYKDYDTDGDGIVDMFYVIFSGAGSNFSGNNQRLVWPHASTVASFSLDGVKFGRYACSTELYGAPANEMLDGIGVICHEFSHVLGLPDLYDTNYNTGGQSIHPNNWSIMAGGSYHNYSRTPCAYTLFERWDAGFAEPEVLKDGGNYTLQSLNKTNKGYRINCGSYDKEFFLLENRQQEKWNAYLPGHGLMIYRVDYSDMKVWDNNTINATSSHNYFELLRAKPYYPSPTAIKDSDGDPFPGSGNVTEINHETKPALVAFAKVPSDIVLSDIAEAADGTISFKATKIEIPSETEDFQALDQSLLNETGKVYTGKYSTWTVAGGAKFAKSVQPSTKTVENSDNYVVAMVKNGLLTSGQIDKELTNVSFSYCNTSSKISMLTMNYSLDKGITWTPLTDALGNTSMRFSAGSSGTVTMPITDGKVANAILQLKQSTGDTESPVEIDNITISYKGDISGINDIISSNDNDQLSVTIEGNLLRVEGADGISAIEVYDITGKKVTSTSPSEAVLISLPEHGAYIVTNGAKKPVKIIF